jgi:hypothetical protein
MRVISNAQSPSSCRDGPLLAAVCVLGAQCKHPLWILSARLPTPAPRESAPVNPPHSDWQISFWLLAAVLREKWLFYGRLDV